MYKEVIVIIKILIKIIIINNNKNNDNSIYSISVAKPSNGFNDTLLFELFVGRAIEICSMPKLNALLYLF